MIDMKEQQPSNKSRASRPSSFLHTFTSDWDKVYSLGEDGYELVCVVDGIFYMKKQVTKTK